MSKKEGVQLSYARPLLLSEELLVLKKLLILGRNGLAKTCPLVCPKPNRAKTFAQTWEFPVRILPIGPKLVDIGPLLKQKWADIFSVQEGATSLCLQGSRAPKRP